MYKFINAKGLNISSQFEGKEHGLGKMQSRREKNCKLEHVQVQKGKRKWSRKINAIKKAGATGGQNISSQFGRNIPNKRRQHNFRIPHDGIQM